MRQDEFSRLHPATGCLYYVLVIVITVVQLQPVLVAISLFCAALYHFYLRRNAGLPLAITALLVFVISAVINPLFSHKGSTLLFYMPTGNPVTLESLIYGIFAAGAICAVLFWCFTLRVVFTEDKVLALIGTVMPTIAALVNLTFRFVPLFVRQGRKVAQANRALGIKNKGLVNKIKFQLDIFSTTTTWALENSVDTADSMRARGYGTGRRTSYHEYHIDSRDIVLILWMAVMAALVLWALMSKQAAAYYYPIIRMSGNVVTYISYLFLCLTPILFDLYAKARWKGVKACR